ncbi:MAG: hypothetical protein WAZ48_03230 [Lysobacteraceae bacterium]
MNVPQNTGTARRTDAGASSRSVTTLIVATVLLVFCALCAGYYASYETGDFPDENAHLSYVTDVAKSGFPDYREGMISTTDRLNYLPHPALYYVSSGEILRMTGNAHGHKTIRIVNLISGILILLIIFWSMRAMELKALATFVGLSIPVVVPMFAVLSASINNDPFGIVGCALVCMAFVLFYDETRRSSALTALLTGFAVACLSKATAALTVSCMTAFFIVFNRQLVLEVARNLNWKQIFAIFSSASLVVGYYIFMRWNYGAFFPAPQGDPSDWYAADNPNAARWDTLTHLFKFAESNHYTLVTPYGHARFFDLLARPYVVDFIFVAVLVLIWRASGKKAESTRPYWRLAPVLAFSFVTYLVIYFATIRSMHLETGYPGAMQARYLFGFLPIAAIMAAMGANLLRSSAARIATTLLFVSGLALSFYPAYFKILISDTVEQGKGGTDYGELTAGRRFEQTFVAKGSGITKVELLLATYIRANSGDIDLQVVDGGGRVMGGASVAAKRLTDNGWTEFRLNDIALVRGESYALRLTSKNSRPGNAITWWAAENGKRAAHSKLMDTHYDPRDPEPDLFADGNAIVDGVPKRADFAFNIRFSNHD